jgi:DNA-binding Xre family transcriptional regulator
MSILTNKRVVMAQRWSFEEDYIVCKFCIENKYENVGCWFTEELAERLAQAGFDLRSNAALSKRARDFICLVRGWESPYAVKQVRAVYDALKDQEKNRELYQRIKAHIQEEYNPQIGYDSEESSDEVVPDIFCETDHTLHMVHTIDFKTTFPMVLQKYMDKKGIKVYSKMCRRIGMKPDTFSSILRGKYGEVKKDNILKICVGLELHVDEAEELMAAAGFTFSRGLMKDVVVKSFLWERIYSVVAINNELIENKEPVLFVNYQIDYDLGD